MRQVSKVTGSTCRTTNKRTIEKVEWPEGAQCAVCLTLDYDAQTLWNSFGVDKLVPISEGEYGPRVGIWRYLDLLDKWGIRGTFFVPGLTAERYPESVREVARRGHEVAYHGYTHEDMSGLSRDEEKRDFQRGIAMIEQLTGKRPTGYRAPAGEFSPNTIDILLEEGFVYHSTCMADEVPYRWEINGKKKDLLEIPFQWMLSDAVHFLFSLTWGPGHISSPSKVYDIWSSEFDGIYEMGRLFCQTSHDFIIGRPSRILLLDKLIRHMKDFPRVWFARCDEIATYWKKRYWE